MKAILNVNPESVYSKYNFQTFNVVQSNGKIFTLLIKEKFVDFAINEILIIDIHNEYLNAYKNDKSLDDILLDYIIYYKISFI